MQSQDRQDQAQKDQPAKTASAETAGAEAGVEEVSPELIEAEALKAKFLNGVSWFYWIGGLSIVNIGMGFLERKFIFGLGISELLQAFALEGASVSIPLLAVGVAVSLAFMGLGWQARKGKKPFILGGLAFYAADAALLAMESDWISVAFHAYAGYSIFKGYSALKTIAAGLAAPDRS